MWDEEKLGKFIKIKHGFAFKGEFFSDSGNFVLLTPGNIYPSGGIKLKGEKEKYYLGEFPKDYLMKKDELLVIMTDLTQTASILGGALLIPEDDRYLHNQRLGLVTIKDKEELDKKFLFFYLNWQYFRDQVIASSNGATVKHTSPDRIYKCKINLPPLPIQQKIADILSAYDDLIENNNKRIALLEKAAEEIYREWFVRMRFPEWEAVKFVKGVPEGWEIMQISELYKTTSGGTPSRTQPRYYDGNIPWVKTGELLNSFVIDTEEKITVSGLENSSAKIFPRHTVVMAMYGVNIGQLGILSLEAASNQACCVFFPNFPYLEYSYTFLLLKSLKEYLISISFGGAQQNVSQDVIKKCKVLRPKPELIKLFSQKINPIYSKIELLMKTQKHLKQSRDLLLSRLISGKLSVEGLDVKSFGAGDSIEASGLKPTSSVHGSPAG